MAKAIKNFMLPRVRRTEGVQTAPRVRSGSGVTGNGFTSSQQPEGRGGKPGKRLMTRVREMMTETSRIEGGLYNTRFDDVADAMVRAMESGSFVHLKEYIDREEGKVPNRLADADGKNIKAYVGMPMDGADAP